MAGRVSKRLEKYWRLEAANIGLLPLAVLLMVGSAGGTPNLTLAIALAVNSILLAIGACYWRIVLARIEGDRRPFDQWIPRLAAAEPYALALTVLTVATTGYDLMAGNGSWPPQRIAAVAITALAALEYINYYRVQLQYFDHAADFAALVKRKSLKSAHLARDIAAWRAQRK